jgi:hypothetical protein
LNLDINRWKRLDLMAHEYGHFINLMYLGDPLPGLPSVHEGFADHNVLRYALFRNKYSSGRPHDSHVSFGYNTNFLINSYRPPSNIPGANDPLEHALRNPKSEVFYRDGQALPSGAAGRTRAMIFVPGWLPPEDYCTDKYECGMIIPVIYWTLAFNKLRVPFGGRNADQLLLYDPNGEYYNKPIELANAAFTQAMLSMSAQGDVDEFFDHVAAFYYDAMMRGWINPEERHRINQAMTVHCVGWSSGTCTSADWHKLPDSLLPASYTGKAHFSDSFDDDYDWQDQEFIRAEDMTRTGGVTAGIYYPVPFGTADGLRYVVLDIPNEEWCTTIAFPRGSGTYKFTGVVYARNTGADSLYARISPHGYKYWDIEDSNFNKWAWSRTGPSFTVIGDDDSPTYRTVCIEHRELLNVEAIVLERL